MAKLGLLPTLALILAFLILLHFPLTYFFASKITHLKTVTSESELDQLLLQDNFQIFGIYNSLHCNKCLTYFQKWERDLQLNPVYQIYNMSMRVIDRAIFLPRSQVPDFLLNANLLLFYSNHQIMFFQEFTRMSNNFQNSRLHFEEIENKALKYISTQIKIFRELISLEDVIYEVSQSSPIAVFSGTSKPIFEYFKQIALEKHKMPLFYINCELLMARVLVYFAGLYVKVEQTIVVLRTTAHTNFVDPESCAFLPRPKSKSHLLELLVIEMSQRLTVDPTMESFLVPAMSGVPMVLFVEGKTVDPERTEKIQIWFAFLRKTRKFFYSCVLGNTSVVLSTLASLRKLGEAQEDWVYFVENGTNEDMQNFETRKLEGKLSLDNLMETTGNWHMERLLGEKNNRSLQKIPMHAIEVLKNFMLGKNGGNLINLVS